MLHPCSDRLTASSGKAQAALHTPAQTLLAAQASVWQLEGAGTEAGLRGEGTAGARSYIHTYIHTYTQFVRT